MVYEIRYTQAKPGEMMFEFLQKPENFKFVK